MESKRQDAIALRKQDQDENGAATTPQSFIGGERIGGTDEPGLNVIREQSAA